MFSKWLLVFFFSITSINSLMAQKQFEYKKYWKDAESALEEGLPQSALEKVNEIWAQAKKEKNDQQLLKALIYKATLIEQVAEDDWQKNLNSFKAELATAAPPAQQVLQSLIADLYFQYFNQQRWKIMERTQVSTGLPEDPETWTVEDFQSTIRRHYLLSLSNAQLLQQTAVQQFDSVIIKGNSRNLRPTLYDLLAHKALDYFTTQDEGITKPSWFFELHDYASLAAAPIFIRYDYASGDSSSNTLAAIKIYQQLLAFHRSTNNQAAFVDADIARLNFAWQQSVNESKDQLYKETLEQIFTTNTREPYAMQAGYLLAQWWQTQGDKYVPGIGTPEQANALQIAADQCRRVIRLFPKSEGGINAAQLLQQLEQQTLSITTEKVNTINKPFRALMQFKNTSKIWLRLLVVNEEVSEILNSRYRSGNPNGFWEDLAAQPAMRSWTQDLPATRDLRQHSAEIKVDGLSNGYYLLLASTSAVFQTGKNALAAVACYVSDISYVRSHDNYFILHRQTGQPLAKAKVTLYSREYDYNNRQYRKIKTGEKIADANGRIHAPVPKNKQGTYLPQTLDIQWKNDRLFLTDAEMPEPRRWNNKENWENTEADEQARYFIFTDRSIYRPAQTIYFKAIGVINDKHTRHTALYQPGKAVVITLYDANYQAIDSLSLQANEMGSISGSFEIPQGLMTGTFSLRIGQYQNSHASIRVEEYKRPKFYVEIPPIEKVYRLGDTVSIEGMAKAFAGNVVDGAKVSYRVYRTPRFPEPWLFGFYKIAWPPYDTGERMEITHGTTRTDEQGKFIVQFAAIPDRSIDKKLQPAFDYAVEVSVTDLNGETQEEKSTTRIGYKAIQLSLSQTGGEFHAAKRIGNARAAISNLAGKPIAAPLRLELVALKSPITLYRKRYWPMPDTTVISRQEFVKYFPTDEYRNESDYHSWSEAATVWKQAFSATATKDTIQLPQDLKPGWYVLKGETEDEKGQTVQDLHYFGVYGNGQLPAMAASFSPVTKQTIEPGEAANFIHGTSLPASFVIQQVMKEETNDSSYEFIKTAAGIQPFTWRATENDRGGFSINRIFVYDNRAYTLQWRVMVPWTNKQLKIELETFRNKLLPGEQEKWKVKISGAKGESVAAEMLASMYDASLDKLEPHQWQPMNLWPDRWFPQSFQAQANFNQAFGDQLATRMRYESFDKRYDQLLTLRAVHSKRYQFMLRGAPSAQAMASDQALAGKAAGVELQADETQLNETIATTNPPPPPDDTPSGREKPADNTAINIRKDFRETAFFLPGLRTDESGSISFEFTMPEALTQWKLQMLAHNKELATGLREATVITQKELMVQPNAPRFLRQGDQLEFVTKVVNLSPKEITGTATLELLDAETMKPVDGIFNNAIPNQYFTAASGQSAALSFPLQIPAAFNGAVVYRIVARASADAATGSSQLADGEEMALPVLSNRMLVTQSFPINMRNTNTKKFTWEKLLQSATQSNTFQQHLLTVEYTTNPVWYAVQALPYLMEYPYDCAEQTWNRFYANALASTIANSTPKLKAVFEQWKTKDTAALLSNLQKNQQLKAILLEETPWVLQAKSEAEQKKNIALLFDLMRMQQQATEALAKLEALQSPNGGFVWFKGGPDDRYMTQYIVTGMGHLRKLNAIPASAKEKLNTMAYKAIAYLDARMREDYQRLIDQQADMKTQQVSNLAVHYLYLRSFFAEVVVPANTQKAYDYYYQQAKSYWLKLGKYEQAMMALVLHRTNNKTIAAAILKSLAENSITQDEMGMYWKELNNPGYYWWEAPIEIHSLLLEAFHEIENNNTRINDLRTWLLKQKQTTHWKTTKATAEACYALLVTGTNWLQQEQQVEISLGSETIKPDAKEAGTGYFSTTISGEKIKPGMGNITVKLKPENKTDSRQATSWGALYWQYFENLDKITPAATPLNLKKDIWKIVATDRGPKLESINDESGLKVGDKVKVRLEIRTDRKLEYVHVKDMRASCFEPVEVLSQYKYQDGLGYYQSIQDASMNFFIGYLARGTYVFEYELKVTHAGQFSNGITSIQCMYAPEFSSHSQGIRVNVDKLN